METWNGFNCESFDFEGYNGIVVFPNEKPNGKLALKTEYWNAFPDVEINLLKKGFHLAYLKNQTRFATREECDRKARFIKFISEKYGLCGKCVPVGMSCGGAHAVNFAGYHPELVSCMFIDAPVLNFCDFPGKITAVMYQGVWKNQFENEFIKAYPGVKRSDLLCFEGHPINRAKVLIENKIPIIMVYGTEDNTVNYYQNGALLEDALEGTGLLKVVPVKCRGHHPHGKIGDNTEIIEFIMENS